MQVVNTNIIKHPLNWLVIWSMVLVAAFVAHLLLSFFNNRHPGQTAGPGTTSTDTVS